MAKYYGIVGYVITEETSPGVWGEVTNERPYYGDIVRNMLQVQPSDQLNDNIKVANVISIVADPFANQNFHSMRYVEYMGTNWKISNVEVQYPRLMLTMGGVYNAK